MNGEMLYRLWCQKMLEQGIGTDEWGELDDDRQKSAWNAMADSIAVKFDPDAVRSSIAERLASAECIIRQVALDTFGEELTPKEFADRSSYDS